MLALEGLVVDRGPLRLEMSLEVSSGEVVGVLGPNGAGKTTLLRAVAGLSRPSAGSVRAGGAWWDRSAIGEHRPPHRRSVGLVFQERLLFSHLTVVANVAFGPRSRGASRAEADRRARAWLDRVGIGALADHHPGRLSGGQAQRVALARALAAGPEVLLLDEPLAAIDVQARQAVRRTLHEHLGAFPGPCLLVTHDPVEALTLADRLVVLEDGRVTQTGTPAEVSRRPRSRWVAELVGVNLLRGTARRGVVELTGGGRLTTATDLDGPVDAIVHPHAVSLHRDRPGGSPRNVWAGRVGGVARQGRRVRVHVDGEPPVVAEVTPQAVADLDLGAGGRVWVSVKATEITCHRA